MEFFCGDGSRVVVGREIGHGGEGTVYELRGINSEVAKVYKQNLRAERREKIEEMSTAPAENLKEFIAWPTSCLYVDSSRQEFAGFRMPRISVDHTPAHRIYSPMDRKQQFPGMDWRFLVVSASNACRAIQEIHRFGHVVGDLNQSNVLVSKNALVHLIDADSIQFRGSRRLFPCRVGVPEFTPPELQTINLGTVQRTPNHDNFALAVLIFHFLFMGKHPFSGHHTDNSLTLPQAIKRRLFVYSTKISGRSNRPPYSLSLNHTGQSLARLFERAFLAGANGMGPVRPTPREWIEALEEFGKTLVRCPNSNTHFFVSHAGPCPWCEFSAHGIDFFPGNAAPRQQDSPTRPLEITAGMVQELWKQIQNVPKRPSFDESVITQTFEPVELPKFEEPVKIEQFIYPLGCITLMTLSVLGKYGVLAVVGAISFAILSAVINMVAEKLFRKGPAYQSAVSRRQKQQRFAQRIVQIQQQIKAARDQHDQSWVAAMKSLEEAKRKLSQMPLDSTEQARVARENLISQKTKSYLERNLISRSRIAGVGPTLISELRSFGFETAWDVLATTDLVSKTRAPNPPPIRPKCPRCGSEMVKKSARRGRYAGTSFWGCKRYPACTGLVNDSSTYTVTTAPSGKSLQSVPGIGPVRESAILDWAVPLLKDFKPVIHGWELSQEIERLRKKAYSGSAEHLEALREGPRELEELNKRFSRVIGPLVSEMSKISESWRSA